MQRAIDHLVICVDDLDRAADIYERLGFTLTPPARHPFGTANQLAQLQGSFLELLAVADRTQIPPPQAGRFSFGSFNAEFLSRREGMSMLVFQSGDARQDQARFVARGLDTYEPFDFSRRARLPDGTEVTVSFSLAFVTHAAMPEAAFFVCQHHAPQYFWKPEYQRHANGASAVAEVVMAAESPAQFGDFFERLLDPQAVETVGDGLRIALSGAAMTILDPDGLRARWPDAGLEEPGAGPRFVGYRVSVADIGHAEAVLRRGEVPFRRQGDVLRIASRDALDATIEFAPAGNPA
jgi:hypothetical protein